MAQVLSKYKKLDPNATVPATTKPAAKKEDKKKPAAKKEEKKKPAAKKVEKPKPAASKVEKEPKQSLAQADEGSDFMVS